jgi:hypothetical protein
MKKAAGPGAVGEHHPERSAAESQDPVEVCCGIPRRRSE